MALTVAGPGTRSYAFVIDWHVRLLLALAWVLLGLVVRLVLPHGADIALTSSLFLLTVAAPAVLIYILYHPVLEVVMQGRTPGKRMAGARIVTREGATPATGALLMRNVLRLVDSLPIFYVVGLICCLATTQRVRLGDMAAGTVLVIDETAAASSPGRFRGQLRSGRLHPEAHALVADLLERWAELDPANRVTLARTVLLRLDAGAEPDALAALDEPALHSRLHALL